MMTPYLLFLGFTISRRNSFPYLGLVERLAILLWLWALVCPMSKLSTVMTKMGIR
jgi:hypothetical protein